ALERRDADEQARANRVDGAARAQGQAESSRASAAQPTDRAALPDPAADPQRNARLYPDASAHCGSERLGVVYRCRGGPDRAVFRRHSPTRQHGLRSLSPLRLRRSKAPDRPTHCQPRDRVPGGGHGTTAQDQWTAPLKGARPPPLGPWDACGVPRRRRSGRRPAIRPGRAGPHAVGAPPLDSMSKFLKAFELAEQERALRRPPGPSELLSEPGPTVPETVPDQALRSFVEASRGVANGLEEHLVSLLEPTSFEAEQYRVLRHLIEQLHKSAALSALANSPPGVADRQTTTAINLAGALAQARDARVLLVDADLRRPALATRLGLSNRPGLADAILDGNLTLEAVVQVRSPLNLS